MQFTMMWMLLILFFSVDALILPLSTDIDLEDVLAVISRYFNESHSLAIVTDECNMALSARILDHLQATLGIPIMYHTITQDGKVTEIIWPHEAHELIIVQNFTSPHFQQTLALISKSCNFIPSGKTILINSDDSPGLIQSVFSQCWAKYQMYNLVILARINDRYQAFGFIPENSNQRCSSSNSANVKNLQLTDELFPDKMLNMNKCYVKLTTVSEPPYSFIANNELSGIFGDLIDILKFKMNVTFKVDMLKSVSYNNFGSKIISYKSDILAVAVLPTSEMINYFDTTRNVGHAGLTFAVQRAKLYSPWTFVFRAFNLTIWFCIAATFICLSLFLKFLKRLLNCAHPKLRNVKIYWCTFAGYLGVIIDTIYQSSLFREITFPERKPEIKTIEQLLNSRTIIRAHPDITKYFLKSERKELIDLASQFIDSKDIVHDLNLITNMSNLGVIGDTYLLHSLRNTIKKGELKIYIAKQHSLIVYYNMFYLRKQSIFTEKLNDIFDRLAQYGFINKWYNDWIIVKIKSCDKKIKDHRKVLSINHLFGIFLIWIIGILLSSIVFIYEILLAKLIRIHLQNT